MLHKFCNLDFEVPDDVLPPYSETTTIVSAAIESLRNIPKPRILDIGTGSGNIIITVLKHHENASGIGLDLSPVAVSAARLNSEINAVSSRLELKLSDGFEKLEAQKFHLITLNPPYFSGSEFEQVDEQIRNRFPKNAVTDGADGLTLTKRIIKEVPAYIVPNGVFLIECSEKRIGMVTTMFDRKIWRIENVFEDFSGIPRVIKTRKL